MADSTFPTRAPLDWMEVLDHIDQSLAQSLLLANQPAPPDPPPSPAELPHSLRRLLDRLTTWQQCLDRAAADANEADTAAATATQSLHDWQQKAALARETLSRWTGPATSGRAPSTSD